MSSKNGATDLAQSTRHGAIPGAPDDAAFSTFCRNPAPLPIIVSVPHAGRDYPADLVRRMRSPGDAAMRLEDRLVDLVAQAVARATGASLIIAHAPRAMIDLNRSIEDIDWGMVAGGGPAGSTDGAAGSGRAHLSAGRRARSGLGLVPRRLPGIGELWRHKLSASELATRIEQVHRPYHHAIARLLEDARDKWGRALLIDLHSMPPLGPTTGSDAAPRFVIGDRFGAACDATLVQAALDELGRAGERVAHNRPYAGGYVLDRHGLPARGLNAIQIEICRSAYLDLRLREPGAGLTRVVDVLSGLVRRLADELAGHADTWRQAAE